MVQALARLAGGETVTAIALDCGYQSPAAFSTMFRRVLGQPPSAFQALSLIHILSCQLLVCSSALTEDFYKAFLRKGASQLELVWVGRAMVLLVAVIAIWLASNPENRVLGLVSYACLLYTSRCV